jgi:hypothetical protein
MVLLPRFALKVFTGFIVSLVPLVFGGPSLAYDKTGDLDEFKIQCEDGHNVSLHREWLSNNEYEYWITGAVEARKRVIADSSDIFVWSEVSNSFFGKTKKKYWITNPYGIADLIVRDHDNISNRTVCISSPDIREIRYKSIKEHQFPVQKSKALVDKQLPSTAGSNLTQIASSSATAPKTELSEEITKIDDKVLCLRATDLLIGYNMGSQLNQRVWSKGDGIQRYIQEAKRRGLRCGVGEASTSQIASSNSSQSNTPSSVEIANLRDTQICNAAVIKTKTVPTKRYWNTGNKFHKFVEEAARRGLNCRVTDEQNPHAWKFLKSAQVNKSQKNSKSSAALTAAEKEAERLRQELAALKAQQEQRQKTITADTQKPTITASASSNGTDGIISGTVRDNVEVAEVMVDGLVVVPNANGSFKTELYIPRSGKTVEIVAVDTKGNKATKSLFLERGAVQGATGPVFASLNPSGKRVRANKDALALIIGVADYERTSAKAAYADKDAKTFYDYALLKLGIPAGNIKELVNVDANRIDVSLAIKDWIARTTKQGSSDIYVFFAGHGLASQSGEQMYLLPYDGSPRLLEDSAISRDRLFADISAANPRSVTVFLDTCYSGTTRGTDMLIASRPIAIKALKQLVPDNFTVMTAARGDQTAKPLEEAKHGMFSYFLMKGMEGDADANQDNQITAGELHQYVEQNVVQQSSGSQTPELQGDANRVLVRFQ